jgi:hypothetical protein
MARHPIDEHSVLFRKSLCFTTNRHGGPAAHLVETKVVVASVANLDDNKAPKMLTIHSNGVVKQIRARWEGVHPTVSYLLDLDEKCECCYVAKAYASCNGI